VTQAAGLEPIGDMQAEFGHYFTLESAKWGKLIRTLSIKLK